MKYQIIIYLVFIVFPFGQVCVAASDALDEVTIKVIQLDEVQLDQVEMIGLPNMNELSLDEPLFNSLPFESNESSPVQETTDSGTTITTTPE